MRLRALAIAGVLIAVFDDFIANAQTFGGYECTDDCSGHKAGYEWAEAKGITDEEQCEDILVTAPNRTSFYEGCMAYVEDPSRGADEDDDGNDIQDHRSTRR